MNPAILMTLPLLLTFGAAALGNENSSAHGHGTQHAQADTSARPQVDAVVRTVDKSARKITLRHGEIPNLDMGPMTMVFQVQDVKLLDKVKAGDKVRFTADQIHGDYTVLSIEPITE